jgi:hypothetical protein
MARKPNVETRNSKLETRKTATAARAGLAHE